MTDPGPSSQKPVAATTDLPRSDDDPGSSENIGSSPDSRSSKDQDSGDSETRVPQQVNLWNSEPEWKGVLDKVMEEFNVKYGSWDLDINKALSYANIETDVMHCLVSDRLDIALKCLQNIDFEFRDWQEYDLGDKSIVKIQASIDTCMKELKAPNVTEIVKMGLWNFLDNLKECLLTGSRQEIHFVSLFRSFADLSGLNFQNGVLMKTQLNQLSRKPFSSIPDLVAFMSPKQWTSSSQILAIAEVKKLPPITGEDEDEVISSSSEMRDEDMFALRKCDKPKSTVHERRADRNILGQIVGEMLGSYKDSAFREIVFAFAVQETKVKLFILHMKPYDYDRSQDKPRKPKHSSLHSTKYYDFLRREDRPELMRALGMLASYKIKESDLM